MYCGLPFKNCNLESGILKRDKMIVMLVSTKPRSTNDTDVNRGNIAIPFPRMKLLAAVALNPRKESNAAVMTSASRDSNSKKCLRYVSRSFIPSPCW